MSNEDKQEDGPVATEPGSAEAPDDAAGKPEPDTDEAGSPASSPVAETETAEPEVAPATAEAVAPTPRQGSGGIAWLALLLALLGVAAVGFSFVQDWRARQSAEAGEGQLADTVAALGDRLRDSNETAAGLRETIADLQAANAGLTEELVGLRDQVDRRLSLLDSLPPRMNSIEASMATLQGVSAGARETWLVAEAEYYMQIANSQLQLAGNPGLALIALRMADERVLQLANPALIDVRRTLADELAALEAMEKPDIEGATLTLASLARVVGSLPLRRAGLADDADVAAHEPESGSIDRVWNSIKRAFSELVKVTPADRAEMPLVAPEAEYFLRTNLTLQLQAARIALLRGEQAVFEQSLDDATAWLHEHFDRQSAPVTSALQTITEIRQGMVTVEAPDISQSLKLLRQYKALAETEQ